MTIVDPVSFLLDMVPLITVFVGYIALIAWAVRETEAELLEETPYD